MKQQFSLSPSLRLTQKQVITAKMIYDMKILTLSSLELETMARQELDENPLLTSDDEQLTDSSPTVPVSETDTIAEWRRYLDYLGTRGSGTGSAVRSDDDRPDPNQSISRLDTLEDSLRKQLRLTVLQPDEREFAERVIENLDDRGYLDPAIFAALTLQVGMELDEAEAVLDVIHNLEPLGIGARDLRECLLVQARGKYPHEDLMHTIIADHLQDLAKRRSAKILSKLVIERDDLVDALDLMGSLEPRPTRMFETSIAEHIRPDLVIHEENGAYEVRLLRGAIPSFKISNEYRRLLNGKNVETASYVKEKLEKAQRLLNAIENRKATILKVTESIVRHQYEFFASGGRGLKPLTMLAVAEDIGMHQSTVSRTVRGKYAETPAGIFELRYFFQTGVVDEFGNGVSSESVKAELARIIKSENPSAPLSDQKLSDLLKAQGIQVERRTIAKYRTALRIGSASERRPLV